MKVSRQQDLGLDGAVLSSRTTTYTQAAIKPHYSPYAFCGAASVHGISLSPSNSPHGHTEDVHYKL